MVYHIDGASAVNSKSVNLWPIQCFIVELPPKLRYWFANILVRDLLWCPKKSDLNIFQERFVSELEQTQNFQVQIEVDSVNIVIERINLHGHLADLVSKALYLFFCQFSGKNECSVCLHPAERVQQRTRSIHIYPYQKPGTPLLNTCANTFACKDSWENKKGGIWGERCVVSSMCSESSKSSRIKLYASCSYGYVPTKVEHLDK